MADFKLSKYFPDFRFLHVKIANCLLFKNSAVRCLLELFSDFVSSQFRFPRSIRLPSVNIDETKLVNNMKSQRFFAMFNLILISELMKVQFSLNCFYFLVSTLLDS